MARRNYELDDLPPRLRDQAARQLAQGRAATLTPPPPPEAVKTQTSAPRRGKYNAQRVTIDGIKFDSKREGQRYAELKFERDELGEVLWFICHPRFDFPVEGGLRWEGDFLIHYTNGEVVVEDVKGVETRTFKDKQKLMRTFYPAVKVRVIK